MTRFIFPAPRVRNIRCGFVLAVVFTAASGRAWPQSAGADLRGIWMAENNADANLERAHVIVDPPDGKIPYRPEAAAQQKQNFANRATADPEKKMLPTRSAARRVSAIAFSDFPERPRRVHRLSGRHSYRIIY